MSSTTTGPQVKSYTYSPTSNRLARIDAQDIGYDAAGNTQGDGLNTYRYSGRNRLVEVKQGGSTLATYQHNAFGERVAKTLGGVTTTFVYDEDGRLLGEYGAGGAPIQETVWLEDTPVATLRPRAGGGIDIYYVWADHLDTPRAITTSAATDTAVWRWESDPFGTAAPQENGLAYNLRFPGQYFDVETGTHYNYFRDYNPGTGRYQQSDPIGLHGGINTYNYVLNDPLFYFDEDGLRGGGKGGGKGGGSNRSRSYKGKCYVYVIYAPDGSVHKYGESCGKKSERCDVQVRKLNRTVGPGGGRYSCQPIIDCAGRADSRDSETSLICQ